MLTRIALQGPRRSAAVCAADAWIAGSFVDPARSGPAGDHLAYWTQATANVSNRYGWQLGPAAQRGSETYYALHSSGLTRPAPACSLHLPCRDSSPRQPLYGRRRSNSKARQSSRPREWEAWALTGRLPLTVGRTLKFSACTHICCMPPTPRLQPSPASTWQVQVQL